MTTNKERSGLPNRRRLLATLPIGLVALATIPRKVYKWVLEPNAGAAQPEARPIIPVPSDVPRIAYLPRDFRLTYVRKNPQEGFGSPNAVMFVYGSPSDSGVRPFPFHICFGRNVTGQFSGTEEARSVPVKVVIDGQGIEAKYFDGMWEPDPQGPVQAANGVRLSWTTKNGHCLVATVNEWTFGLRGYRTSGVSAHELVQVLESAVLP